MKIFVFKIIFFVTLAFLSFSYNEESLAQDSIQPTDIEEINEIAPLEGSNLHSEIEESRLPEINLQIRVALLVPLSGQYADVGKAMLNAAELAVFDINYPGLILMPFDTAGNEESAKKAAEEAIKSGAKIILGPLFNSTTKSVVQIAEKNSINVISFSNDKTLLKNGVFLLSFNPAEQIERVVEFAHNRGVNKFSALVPDNPYGVATINELTDTIGKKGLVFKKVEWYKKTDANLSKSITRVVSLPENVSSTDIPPKSEGLLIPEGGRTLLAIVSRLYSKGLDSHRFRMLGSGEWDDENLAREPKLSGSWFATSPPEKRMVFEQNYKNTYGSEPIRIASLAYDAIALTGFIISSGADFSRKSLVNKRGFSGINGVFRFKNNGLAERGLAVIEMNDGKFNIVDPAPENFTD